MFVLLLGAPGAGKGTQAKRLAEAMNVPHVSSGDLFRMNIDTGTPIGVEAKKYIEQGSLVPDEITLQMIKERLFHPDAQHGAILDGFPRTVSQVPLLDRILEEESTQLDRVLLLSVSEDVLLQRLAGRLICKVCQTSYHETLRPPKVTGICDVCGGELYQRPDDSLETARKRLKVYHEITEPIVAHYRATGNLVEVNGEQSTEDVTRTLLAAIHRPESITDGIIGSTNMQLKNENENEIEQAGAASD